MSETTYHIPPPPPAPPPSKQLGKLMSLAMVVGTVIGSGIYVLPATTAAFGPNVVTAFALTIVGTMTLALAMASLARRLPGGPYAYIAAAFGDLVAFATMWSYLISVWAALAAVCIAAGGALGHLVAGIGSGPGLAGFAIGALIVLALVNATGARSAGALQIAATMIKIVPLLLVVVLVLVRVGSGQAVEPLAPVPLSFVGLVGAAALMLFAFTGFETAALSANVTEDSTHTVPGATIRGTIVVAVLYLTATLSVLWLLPSSVASESGAPFADAIAPVLGSLAGALVTVIAAVSALGTGNAQVLVAVEMMRAIANAGDLPPMFARTNAAGVATVSLWTSVAVGIILILFSISDNFIEVFSFIALISAVAALALYLVCAAAALKLKAERSWLAIIAIAYSVAMFVGAGLEAALWGLALMLAGLPIRWLSRRYWPTIPAAVAAPAAPRE
ncbi:MAG: amino acid permease [Sphingomicrobium sp.]